MRPDFQTLGVNEMDTSNSGVNFEMNNLDETNLQLNTAYHHSVRRSTRENSGSNLQPPVVTRTALRLRTMNHISRLSARKYL